MRKKLKNPRKAILPLVCFYSVVLALFYFVIPVPIAKQQQTIAYTNNFILNNPDATITNIKQWKIDNCHGGYLKGFQFFQFNDAFRKDFQASFDKTGVIDMSSVDDAITSKLPLLCEYDFNQKKP